MEQYKVVQNCEVKYTSWAVLHLEIKKSGAHQLQFSGQSTIFKYKDGSKFVNLETVRWRLLTEWVIITVNGGK